MGPTCEVLLPSDEPSVLETIDAFLDSQADQIERTRKGRVWNLWVDARPIHVEYLAAPPAVALSAGCNEAQDHALLRQLAQGLAAACGGLASEPSK